MVALEAPKSADASPVSLLYERSMIPHCGTPNALGIGPERLLCERYKSGGELTGKEPNDAGMEPVSMFRSRCSAPRLCKFDREEGMGPENWLKARVRKVREVRLERNEGTGPESEFELRSSCDRRVSLVMEEGTEPTSFGSLWNMSCCRNGRSPTASGIVPFRAVSWKTDRPITLPLLSQVMSYLHVHDIQTKV